MMLQGALALSVALLPLLLLLLLSSESVVAQTGGTSGSNTTGSSTTGSSTTGVATTGTTTATTGSTTGTTGTTTGTTGVPAGVATGDTIIVLASQFSAAGGSSRGVALALDAGTGVLDDAPLAARNLSAAAAAANLPTLPAANGQPGLPLVGIRAYDANRAALFLALSDAGTVTIAQYDLGDDDNNNNNSSSSNSTTTGPTLLAAGGGVVSLGVDDATGLVYGIRVGANASSSPSSPLSAAELVWFDVTGGATTVLATLPVGLIAHTGSAALVPSASQPGAFNYTTTTTDSATGLTHVVTCEHSAGGSASCTASAVALGRKRVHALAASSSGRVVAMAADLDAPRVPQSGTGNASTVPTFVFDLASSTPLGEVTAARDPAVRPLLYVSARSADAGASAGSWTFLLADGLNPASNATFNATTPPAGSSSTAAAATTGGAATTAAGTPATPAVATGLRLATASESFAPGFIGDQQLVLDADAAARIGATPSRLDVNGFVSAVPLAAPTTLPPPPPPSSGSVSPPSGPAEASTSDPGGLTGLALILVIVGASACCLIILLVLAFLAYRRGLIGGGKGNSSDEGWDSKSGTDGADAPAVSKAQAKADKKAAKALAKYKAAAAAASRPASRPHSRGGSDQSGSADHPELEMMTPGSGGMTPAGEYRELPTKSDAGTAGAGDSAASSLASRFTIPFSELTMNQEIGRGAFGVVYLGTWRSSKVAIKMLKADGDDIDPKEVESFKREAELMQDLRPHANVVLMLGVTLPPDAMCIVLEFVDNGSLWEYLASDAEIPMTLNLQWIQGMASGLLHLHQEGIIHRDLAARNVLLTASMQAKITDFGMSRESDDDNTTKSETGPLKWMAPEAIDSRVYSWASDVWSFGVVCWEILARSLPYPGLDPVQAASRVCFQGLRLPIPPETPEILRDVMEQCWEAEAIKRPNVKAICAELDRFNQF